jgi:hypothetical protein
MVMPLLHQKIEMWRSFLTPHETESFKFPLASMNFATEVTHRPEPSELMLYLPWSLYKKGRIVACSACTEYRWGRYSRADSLARGGGIYRFWRRIPCPVVQPWRKDSVVEITMRLTRYNVDSDRSLNDGLNFLKVIFQQYVDYSIMCICTWPWPKEFNSQPLLRQLRNTTRNTFVHIVSDLCMLYRPVARILVNGLGGNRLLAPLFRIYRPPKICIRITFFSEAWGHPWPR